MSVIVLLIVAGGLIAFGFLAAFAWAVTSGQFDDTTTPAVRILRDESSMPVPPGRGDHPSRQSSSSSKESHVH